MLKTNCIRQPQSYFPVHLATTIHALNSLITAVLPSSPGYNFLTATLKCICNDSFIDVLKFVSVLCREATTDGCISCSPCELSKKIATHSTSKLQ